MNRLKQTSFPYDLQHNAQTTQMKEVVLCDASNVLNKHRIIEQRFCNHLASGDPELQTKTCYGLVVHIPDT